MSCKKESFVEANLNPATLYEVTPENQFLAASIQINNDYEYYYDVYRRLNYWLQYSTPASGNGFNFNAPGGNFNYRYNNFYNNVGPKLMDAIQIINSLPQEERNGYIHLENIARILLAYYACYTSDSNGSIPYSEAFLARYGGTLTPIYDTQETIFSLANDQISAAVDILKNTTTDGQVNLGSNDPFFNGNVNQWIKAGNALRLRIASRFIKADQAKAQAIISDVLANSDQMAHVDDSWEMRAGPTYADANTNWNPANFIAGKPILDYMKEKADPRLRIYYRPNSNGEYVGGFPSPDDPIKPENAPLYSGGIANFSQLQHRLFTPNYDEGNGAGNGSAFFPIITYAEYCFLRADFAARGLTSDNAEEWYKKGVYASIDYYDRRAQASSPIGGLGVGTGIEGYVSVTMTEKDNYYNATGVKFDPSNALEQIAVQAYFDFYRNPFEAWNWWKRTGYPSTSSTIFEWSDLVAQGARLPLPRRASQSFLPTSNLNYQNQRAALEQMMQDPEYGSGPGDPFGRVWWDRSN
ncbi:Starch-binding associating with outer membrane [Parapedobacter composti]|uniref:Starch-binding associating with outer membrane n=2 Tax=Parapedobacter composti TaxID=623281 RepID=A0A1I1EBF1_9SPHI|nr:Starch-binding associating with outer membrane [Parapedobacter composti]